ncbi:MAG: heavy-metal-associated domain-containing protein [Ruminiclostridium sp.]|nr:heavy-metal-associated domain-containing protein [Ruminiclostridium sp.]
MATTAFNVPSITCSICSGKIQGELKEMAGIETVDIDLKSQQVKVVYNPEEVNPRDIKRRIMTIGYEVVG